MNSKSNVRWTSIQALAHLKKSGKDKQLMYLYLITLKAIGPATDLMVEKFEPRLKLGSIMRPRLILMAMGCVVHSHTDVCKVSPTQRKAMYFKTNDR